MQIRMGIKFGGQCFPSMHKALSWIPSTGVEGRLENNVLGLILIPQIERIWIGTEADVFFVQKVAIWRESTSWQSFPEPSTLLMTNNLSDFLKICYNKFNSDAYLISNYYSSLNSEEKYKENIYFWDGVSCHLGLFWTLCLMKADLLLRVLSSSGAIGLCRHAWLRKW